MLPEKLKVSTVVKNEKSPLSGVLSVNLVAANKFRTKPCSSADHLPELGFRTHLLEEYQIHTFRNVYARVHHIHRDSNMWLFLRNFEIVNGGLSVCVITDYPLGKAAPVFGIQFVEALKNKLRMALVLSKNNGLSDAFAASHFNAPLHQVLNHGVHRQLVEHKLVQIVRGNQLRHHTILNKVLLKALLVRFRQLIVGNPFLQKLGFHLKIVVGNQHMVGMNRRLVVIGIGGNPVLHLKEIVGIPIHVRLRRGSQPHHHSVKIVKNRPVFLENTAVAFINDNQVKVGGGKENFSVLRLCPVNGVQHGRVGGKYHSCRAVVPVGAEIAQGQIR